MHARAVQGRGAGRRPRLLGGEVEFAMVDLLPVLPHVQAGTLKVLAVAGDARAPQMPDVPTTAEAGLPGVLMDTNYGVIAPQGLPADVQNASSATRWSRAVQSPEMKEQLLEQGAVPRDVHAGRSIGS